MKTMALAAVGAASMLPIGAAQAEITVTTTDPGAFTNIDDIAEGRIRLDGGNSQTWKLATWTPDNNSRPSVTNGNGARDLFQNGEVNPFTMTYNAITGELTVTTAGQSITDTILLAPNMGVAGIKYFITSDRGDAFTTLTDMQIVVDGQAPVSLDGLTSTMSGGFIEAPLVYFSQAATTIEITGNLMFGWSDTATRNDRQGDRSRLTVKINAGELPPIPSPGVAGLFGLAALSASRRRR